MAETRLSDIDFYEGVNPTVFKKVDTVDTTISPFQIYKTWTVVSSSVTSSCLPLNGVYSDITILPALGTELVYNDAKNIDNSLQTITYQSINHLFYKNKTKLFNTFGPTDLNRISKFLYLSASILSFPYVKIGEGIKPASFNMQSDNGGIYGFGIYGTTVYGAGVTFDLQSDRYGNVYDTAIPTSSLISGCKFYEGFNEGFDRSRFKYRIISSGSLSFTPGVTATDGIYESIGYASQFDSKSIFIVPNKDIPGYYDRDHDYAISFFVSASAGSSIREQMLIGKSGVRKPYMIVLSTTKRVKFYVVGSTPELAINDYSDPSKLKYVAVTGTTSVTSSWNHVVCQKSGSYMQIYINGSLQVSTDQSILKIPNSPFTESVRIDSNGSTYIGGWNPAATGSNYNGKLDEIRFYNKALTAAEIGYLGNRSETGSMLQTNVVGNVFSKQGLVVISSPNYIYGNILQTPYTASYKSTVTRYELSTLVKADAGDFNMSLNPTLTKDDDITYQGFVSGSGFAPYITTIGLYNDYGELLAIGKLAQPVRKRADVDLNFLVRIDLDKNIIPGER